jgi:hypothetical protein
MATQLTRPDTATARRRSAGTPTIGRRIPAFGSSVEAALRGLLLGAALLTVVLPARDAVLALVAAATVAAGAILLTWRS